jgi:hypothetical protein
MVIVFGLYAYLQKDLPLVTWSNAVVFKLWFYFCPLLMDFVCVCGTRVELRAWCLLGRHSSSWATPPSPILFWFCDYVADFLVLICRIGMLTALQKREDHLCTLWGLKNGVEGMIWQQVDQREKIHNFVICTGPLHARKVNTANWERSRNW